VDDEPRICSVARTLDVVGDKWALLVVREAFLGTHRFDQMQRKTGAPRDILAARLRKLVEQGVLERRRYQERPERFEYHLTPAGLELHPVITALRQWGDRHVTRPGPSPARFEHACGGDHPARLVCPDCGEVVEPGSYLRLPAAPTAAA
jgi:DNA-binding HxlR family transcriptional regulator